MAHRLIGKDDGDNQQQSLQPAPPPQITQPSHASHWMLAAKWSLNSRQKLTNFSPRRNCERPALAPSG
jgi:hypothetical protein